MTCATARRKSSYSSSLRAFSAASFCRSLLFELRGFRAEAIRFFVIERAHVGFGDGSGRAQNALFTAAGAGAVAGDERFVIATDHEVIAQRGFAGILRRAVVVEAEEFLARVGQETREDLRGGVLGVEILGLARHAQRIVITADLHAFAASFAKVGNENAEDVRRRREFSFPRCGKSRGRCCRRAGA